MARDFLCFAEPDAAVVVCDATCLERGLLLVMQVLETCPRTLLCVNLLDEAEKRQIAIDLPQLEQLLGIPVVGMAARSGTGLPEFQQRLFDLLHQPAPQPLPCPVPEQLEQPLEQIQNELPENLCGLQREWTARRLLEPEPELHEKIAAHGNISLEIPALSDALEQTWKQYSPEVCADAMIAAIVRHSEALAAQTVHQPEQTDAADRRLDRILAGKWGIPVMLLLLGLVLWLTIVGANYPSAWLSAGFSHLQGWLSLLLETIHTPHWLHGLLIDGIYNVLTCVIAVMLPPMAIFFPLFTLLEDFGYLPRVAFHLDKPFQRACACGKQGLTMCMGFGCNAAGVTGCRIIDSPRERLIAHHDHLYFPVFRRRQRAVPFCQFCPVAAGADPAGRFCHIRRVPSAVAYHSAGCAVLLYAGTAAVPQAPVRQGAGAFAAGPDDFCTGQSLSGGGTGGSRDLVLHQLPYWRRLHFCTLCGTSGHTGTIHRTGRRDSAGIPAGISGK